MVEGQKKFDEFNTVGGTDNFTDVIADKAKPSRCCAKVLGSLEDLGKAAKVSRSESSQQQTSAVSKQQQ